LDLQIRSNLREKYPDVYTEKALDGLITLAPLNRDRRELMAVRIARRRNRWENAERIRFLDPATTIPRTKITDQEARDGKYDGAENPHD